MFGDGSEVRSEYVVDGEFNLTQVRLQAHICYMLEYDEVSMNTKEMMVMIEHGVAQGEMRAPEMR